MGSLFDFIISILFLISSICSVIYFIVDPLVDTFTQRKKYETIEELYQYKNKILKQSFVGVLVVIILIIIFSLIFGTDKVSKLLYVYL